MEPAAERRAAYVGALGNWIREWGELLKRGKEKREETLERRANRTGLPKPLEGFSALSLEHHSQRGSRPVWAEQATKQAEVGILEGGKQERGQKEEDMEGGESDSSDGLDATPASEDVYTDHPGQYLDGFIPVAARLPTRLNITENETPGNGTEENGAHKNGSRENRAHKQGNQEDGAQENGSQGSSDQAQDTIESSVEEQETAASSPEDLPMNDGTDEVDLLPIPTRWTETLVMPLETPSP